MASFLRIVVMALLVTVGLSSAQQRAPGDAENAKQRAIRALLALSGAEQMATHIMQQGMESTKADTPDVPDKVWKDCGHTVKPTDFVDRLVPIYGTGCKFYTMM